jgi:hypothetical protein
MWRGRTGLVLVAVIGMAALSWTCPSDAQCRGNMPAFDNVATVPGNPFQAEKVTTRTGSAMTTATSVEPPPQLIARDVQGRVRIERVTGKYTIKSGPEAGKEVEQHAIIICDPLNETIIQLDTSNKTAKIFRSATGPTRRQLRPFCDINRNLLRSSTSQAEDLGHRVIEGVDAQGVRTSTQSGASGAGNVTMTTNITAREEWCSDELSAMVLEVFYSGSSEAKTEIALTKLERQEPDAALFEIPIDYQVSERVPTEMKSVQQPPPPRTPAVPNSPNPPLQP